MVGTVQFIHLIPQQQNAMLNKAKRAITIVAAKKLLYTNEPETLSTAKRILSVAAGAYIIQRGLKTMFKSPIISIQETFFGGLLIYNAVKSSEAATERRKKQYRQSAAHQMPLEISAAEPVV
jgi:uncharacterized membrane protein